MSTSTTMDSPKSSSHRLVARQHTNPNILHQSSHTKTTYKYSAKYQNGRRNGSPQRSSTLSLASPTKLNVVRTDWSETQAAAPPLLRSNSTMGLSKTDRFIPATYSSSNGKLIRDDKELQPPANASPSRHIEAQNKLRYQQTVADACGLQMNEKILQFKPRPPPSKASVISLNFKNSQYDFKKNSINPLRSRKINNTPERVLDAPDFNDDFYLNLISWSGANFLAIALGCDCYIWNASSGSVDLLHSFNEPITSVRWSDDSTHLSVGKESGKAEIWDIESCERVRTMDTQSGTRVGVQSWFDNLVATGCRSGEVFVNDVRVKQHVVNTLANHVGEVCGLEYRGDGLQLASGSNDNVVTIWDCRSSLPQFTKHAHTGAVKALAWSPDTLSLLATGGGSSDQKINFWNTTTGARLNTIDTGTQISSLHWGSSDCFGKEIVATGGYPNNAISVYSYEHQIKVAEIEHAHDARIISGQISPDGSILATVGGDENLKFHKIFNGNDDLNKMKSKRNTGLVSGKAMTSKIMTIR